MPNERDQYRNVGRGREWDEDRGMGRFASDRWQSERGGFGRDDDRSTSMRGSERENRGGRWSQDEDVRGRGRDELRSVGSPGIGGGTGGQWDRGASERDRGGDELRYGRGGDYAQGGGGGGDRYAYGREDRDTRMWGGRGIDEGSGSRGGMGGGWGNAGPTFGRGRGEESTYFGDEERFERGRTGMSGMGMRSRGEYGGGESRRDFGEYGRESQRGSGRGMSSSAGWGQGSMGGQGDEDWSPSQTGQGSSVERIGRGWGGDVGRSGGMMGGSPGYQGNQGYSGGQGYGGSQGYGGYQSRRGQGQGQGMGGHLGKGPMNYQRPDQRIREDVCDCLTDDDDVDASGIDVVVDKCEVTLTGTVPSREMKRRAEELAEQIRGVKDVHNQIKVKAEKREGREGREGKETETTPQTKGTTTSSSGDKGKHVS